MSRTTFYVPVERTTIPNSDPKRWLFLVVEAVGPVEAILQATSIARSTMRLKGVTIWAAVRDCPTFEYMQELRESFGRASRNRAGQMGRKVPGYV